MQLHEVNKITILATQSDSVYSMELISHPRRRSSPRPRRTMSTSIPVLEDHGRQLTSMTTKNILQVIESIDLYPRTPHMVEPIPFKTTIWRINECITPTL